MDSNPCAAFFRDCDGDDQKVKKLIACGKGDEWADARLSASEYSPVGMDSEELIVRQVHTPVHWDGENLKLGFYNDISSRGLSLNRLAYADEASLDERSEERAAASQGGREALGFLKCSVARLEEILRSVEGGSGAVFDTALENDVSHADACQTRGARAEARDMRAALFDGLKGAIVRGRLQDDSSAA